MKQTHRVKAIETSRNTTQYIYVDTYTAIQTRTISYSITRTITYAHALNASLESL